MKSKHNKWNLGLKCDHWIWPQPWPWPWIFKVKYGICSISGKNGPIATKRKANISIKFKASNMTIRFYLGQDLDLKFARSNMEFAISQPKMVWFPWNEKWIYKLNSRPRMWPMGLTLAMTLTLNCQGKIKGDRIGSFMTMTFWRPRWGVRIYRIVAGVTLYGSVPSTL